MCVFFTLKSCRKLLPQMPLIYLGMVCLAASLASFAIKCTLWTAKVILKVNYI